MHFHWDQCLPQPAELRANVWLSYRDPAAAGPHPYGMDNATFVEHFTEDKLVVFAFHGYPRVVHEVVHGRPNVEGFHVRGFNEGGTTTTPFDIVVLNGMSR
jgi:xylulose-5-phosphate/fructose-6-phosphate phosphoketolase